MPVIAAGMVHMTTTISESLTRFCANLMSDCVENIRLIPVSGFSFARLGVTGVSVNSQPTCMYMTSNAMTNSVMNTGTTAAEGCTIAPLSRIEGVLFLFAPVDAVTSALSGPANSPVDIPAGSSQKFNITFVPSVPFAPIEVQFNVVCTNTGSAAIIPGLNTFVLSASLTPIPDLVALTSAPGGILSIPSGTSSGVFLIASLNLGAAGLITMSADTGATALPVGLLVCEFNAALGTCFQPPSVTTPPRTITSGEVTFYAVFVISQGTAIPLNPFTNRVFARFRDFGNVVRGLTNVELVVEGTIPTTPDVTGTYLGSGTLTNSNCSDPNFNGTFVFSTNVSITNQIGALANLTGQFSSVVGGDIFTTNITSPSVTVANDGSVTGSFTFTFFINNIFDSSGNGTLSGQVIGNVLSFTASGQVTGDPCSTTGSLSATR